MCFQIRFYDVRKNAFRPSQPIKEFSKESVEKALELSIRKHGKIVRRSDTGLPRFELKNVQGAVLQEAFPQKG